MSKATVKKLHWRSKVKIRLFSLLLFEMPEIVSLSLRFVAIKNTVTRIWRVEFPFKSL